MLRILCFMASTWETSAHPIDCTSSSLEPPFPILRLAHRCKSQHHIPRTRRSRHHKHRSLVRARQLQWFQLCGHLAYLMEILRKDTVHYRIHHRRGALGSSPIQVGHPVCKFQGFFSPNTWPCLSATANYLQGTCNRLVFLLTTAPHNLHDCPPLGSLVISWLWWIRIPKGSVYTTPPLGLCFQACAPNLASTAVAKTVCFVCLAFLGSWGSLGHKPQYFTNLNGWWNQEVSSPYEPQEGPPPCQLLCGCIWPYFYPLLQHGFRWVYCGFIFLTTGRPILAGPSTHAGYQVATW